MQLKPEKVRIGELSYQPEKLYTEDLLEVLIKSIAEEINTTLKNKWMACMIKQCKFTPGKSRP